MTHFRALDKNKTCCWLTVWWEELMHTQPIITTVAEAESRVVGAQRKSGFAGGLLLLGNSAGHGWRRGVWGLVQECKSARAAGAWRGANPRAIRVVAWHGPCHVAGAQWTLEETKMHYVPLSLGVFPAYLKYNPGTFLRFMRLYISCLPNSPLYIYDHSLPWWVLL